MLKFLGILIKNMNFRHLSEKTVITEFLKVNLCEIAKNVWRDLAHGHIFFDSVQPLLELSEQRAWCTFFSLLPSASLLRCGLMVSSPEPWASSGGRLPEALFLVFRLESQGAKACKSCRSRQELSNEYLLFSIYLQKLASIKPRTSLSKFAKISQKLE